MNEVYEKRAVLNQKPALFFGHYVSWREDYWGCGEHENVNLFLHEAYSWVIHKEKH